MPNCWLLVLGCFLFDIVYASQQSNKIVYMISPPRSLSVAFTRMVYERGDFDIFLEPSLYAHACTCHPKVNAKLFRSVAYPTFDKVKQALYNAAEHRPVFVKEVSFAVGELLLKDPEFVQHENIYFAETHR